MISLSELQSQVHKVAREKGWWPDYIGEIDYSKVNIPEKLMLMVSEISEALEHYRGGEDITNIEGNREFFKGDKPDGFWIELADCIIRILDLAGAYDVNMETLVKLKHEYNKTRPFRHGGKKC